MTWERKDPERLAIEELLPWYATGRLSAADRARVEAYLAEHPDVEAGLLLARQEAEATVAANEAVRGPNLANLDRLLRSLPEQPRRVYAGATVLQRLAEWIGSLNPLQLGMATAALLAIFLAQAVTIGTLLGSRPGVYETATGPSEPTSADSVVLLIGFKPEATMADLVTLLKNDGLTLIDGPRAGLFRVRAPGSAQSAEAVAARLKASPLVVNVLPSGR